MTNPAEIFQGPVFIGLILNVFLCGIVITQAYLYYATYKRDETWLKMVVLAITLAETLNTVFNVISTYLTIIAHFGETEVLDRATWYSATAPGTTTIITVMVQLFFAWRIHVLTGSWIMVLTVISFSITGGAGGAITTHKIVAFPRYSLIPSFRSAIIVWIAAASAADIIITVILVWHLVCSFQELHKHKTGFKRSDMIVDRVIRITMQTGFLTSMVSIIDLILYLVMPTRGTHMILNLPLSKLYSNSLLSSLNSRGGWRYNGSTVVDSTTVGSFIFQNSSGEGQLEGRRDTALSSVAKAIDLLGPARPGSRSDKPQVFVHVESHQMGDEGCPNARRAKHPDAHV